MFYNVLKAKDIADFGEEKFRKVVLMEHDDNCLSVIAIKKTKLLILIHLFVMLQYIC